METKTDLAGALYRTLGAVLTLLEETMDAGEGDNTRLTEAKIKGVHGVSRVIATIVTAFCRLGLTGDDDVNDSTALEQYRAEIDRRIAALDIQIERKRAEIAAEKAALAGGGSKRRGSRDGGCEAGRLEPASSRTPAAAEG